MICKGAHDASDMHRLTRTTQPMQRPIQWPRIAEMCSGEWSIKATQDSRGFD